MTTQDYLSDVDCFRSYTALRNMIYYNKKTPVKVSNVVKKTTSGTKSKKTVVDLNEFRNDKNVILAIQNDARFINIIMNCRKQRSPVIYLFVDTNSYITCVIKNPNGYPIIFVRIPIDNVYAYSANNVNNVYELPLTNLLNKDIKYVKNNSYLMLFRHNNQNVDFDYDMTQSETQRNKITINNISVHSMSVINNMLNDRYGMTNQNYGLMPNGKDICSNFLLELYNMNVLVLKEIQDANSLIQFTQKQTNKTKNYIEVENDTMNFVNEVANSKNVKFICSSSDSIIWSNVLNGKSNTNVAQPSANTDESDDENDMIQLMKRMQGEVESDSDETTTTSTKAIVSANDGIRRFNILSYESLFKMNYNKSITSNDKLYYVFGSYLGNFLFMKFITSLDVNIGDGDINEFNLIKIFQRGYQIIECYMCEEM